MKKNKEVSKYFKSPYLEIIIMITSVILAYYGLAIISLNGKEVTEGIMSAGSVSWLVFGFFMLSLAIAVIAVIAGIGGGVIFTPVMLAFTTINRKIVAGAGLIVAMFSGLISVGIFTKKKLSNYRLALIMTIAQSIGALIGAIISNSLSSTARIDAIINSLLGILLAGLAVYFLIGGKKLDFPEVKKVDRLTAMCKLDGSYYEESEERVQSYKVKNLPAGLVLIIAVGFIGGFFGMGGGWAITPVLNMCMGIPVKMAAATSGVILGVGSCVSIWPYIYSGAVIPLFALPWLSGQVIGGFIGSYALAKIKVKTVRIILIGIMVFTAFGLVSKGIVTLINETASVPSIVNVIAFAVIFIADIAAIILESSKNQKRRANDE